MLWKQIYEGDIIILEHAICDNDESFTFNDTTMTFHKKFPELEKVYEHASKYATEHKLEHKEFRTTFKPYRVVKERTSGKVFEQTKILIRVKEEPIIENISSYEELRKSVYWNPKYIVKFALSPAYLSNGSELRIHLKSIQICFEQK